MDTCRSTNPVSRGSGKGWGRGVAKSMNGHYEVAYEGIPLGNGVAGGSWGEVGPRGEVPVREEKAGGPARGGEKARPGSGFCVSPPLLAPWTRLDRRPWGQDGGLSAPGTPSFAPWDVGVDHEPERVPKAWKSFPPEGGEEVAA